VTSDRDEADAGERESVCGSIGRDRELESVSGLSSRCQLLAPNY
jgi:hypothetical protein